MTKRRKRQSVLQLTYGGKNKASSKRMLHREAGTKKGCLVQVARGWLCFFCFLCFLRFCFVLFFEYLNFILFIFLYSRFLLVIYFIHISVYMSIPISQFIPPPPAPHPATYPLGVHTFVLYICVSTSALHTGSSVPFF